jgi:tRNA-binding EMAP/Myf-like protein
MAETKSEGEKAAKTPKINKLDVAEIDAKLNEIRTAQGGLGSRYAKQLLLRKKVLGK